MESIKAWKQIEKVVTHATTKHKSCAKPTHESTERNFKNIIKKVSVVYFCGTLWLAEMFSFQQCNT